MAETAWNRWLKKDQKGPGGPVEVTLEVSTHLAYPHSQHAAAKTAAEAGLASFRAWIAGASFFDAETKAWWASLPDGTVENARQAALL